MPKFTSKSRLREWLIEHHLTGRERDHIIQNNGFSSALLINSGEKFELFAKDLLDKIEKGKTLEEVFNYMKKIPRNMMRATVDPRSPQVLANIIDNPRSTNEIYLNRYIPQPSDSDALKQLDEDEIRRLMGGSFDSNLEESNLVLGIGRALGVKCEIIFGVSRDFLTLGYFKIKEEEKLSSKKFDPRFGLLKDRALQEFIILNYESSKGERLEDYLIVAGDRKEVPLITESYKNPYMMILYRDKIYYPIMMGTVKAGSEMDVRSGEWKRNLVSMDHPLSYLTELVQENIREGNFKKYDKLALLQKKNGE